MRTAVICFSCNDYFRKVFPYYFDLTNGRIDANVYRKSSHMKDKRAVSNTPKKFQLFDRCDTAFILIEYFTIRSGGVFKRNISYFHEI